jgi:hypothetical protein
MASDAAPRARVSNANRLLLSILLGVVAGGVTAQSNLTRAWPRDFTQVWFAARSLLSRVDPYPLVGPHGALDWQYPLLYPLTAAVAAIPLTPFPAPIACVMFSALGGAAFAWALMEHGYAPLFGFFGASLRFAAETAQWSPLLAAAVVVPPLAILYAAKPTISVALFAARPSWWPIVGGLVLSAIAFAIQPHWVASWLDAIARNDRAWLPDVPYRAPIMLPGGVLALACLARWRRPEARLVAALACIPQTPMLYETVPLFLVPRSFRETAILVALSYGVFVWVEAHLPVSRSAAQYLAVSGPAIALLLFVPTTIMVLRRPNEGAIPPWLERAISGWPRWARGRRGDA